MFLLSDVMSKKRDLPKPGEALPGRDRAIPTATRHYVSNRPLKGPYPEGLGLPISAWAASGAPSACSGRPTASG